MVSPRSFYLPAFSAAAVSLVSIAAALEAPAFQFDDVTEAAGLVKPLAGLMGHGGAWGDFDGDGKIDIFVGGFSDRPNAESPAAGPIPNHLFRNLGGGRFESVESPAVGIFARTSGAVFADLDNDGSLELYVANNAKAGVAKGEDPQRSAKNRHSQLIRTSGGKLTDIGPESGSCPETLNTARNVGALDYDGDGLLDLFVVEDKFTKNPRSVLLHNDGGLKFHDANAETGLPNDIFGLGLAVADINEDGRPDIYVGHSNRCFLSQPGGKYREAVELAPVFRFEPFDGEDWPCGAAFGDLNRDGRLDLVVSTHGIKARNRVFLNGGVKDGIPQFREITKEAGLADIIPARCPHVEIQDFDNDGWPDIYVSAAWKDGDAITPLIYRNAGLRDGLPSFVPPRPIGSPMVYYPAGPSGDYDQDGRLDLFLINWFPENHSRLLHNTSSTRNWLQVRVTGKSFNRMGIGSQVKVYQKGKIGQPAALLGFQEITIGFGYASGQPAIAHFGLGDASEVDLQVRLPDGKTIDRAGVKAGQLLSLEQP